MATYVTPKKNTEYILWVGLIQQADPALFQAAPTLAAGDFTVSIDGAAAANLATLPTVTPAGGKRVKITLSAAEMNGDNIIVLCSDAAGAQWCDKLILIQTTARQVDDLAYPATSGRSLLVNATGAVPVSGLEAAAQAEVNAQMVDVVNVDVVAEAAGVPAATGTINSMLGRLYAALRSGVSITATKKQFKNDAGVNQWEKDLSDDGTTYSESAGNAP